MIKIDNCGRVQLSPRVGLLIHIFQRLEMHIYEPIAKAQTALMRRINTFPGMAGELKMQGQADHVVLTGDMTQIMWVLFVLQPKWIRVPTRVEGWIRGVQGWSTLGVEYDAITSAMLQARDTQRN